MPQIAAAVEAIAIAIGKGVFAVTGSAAAANATAAFIYSNAAALALMGAQTTYSSIQRRKAARAAKVALNQGRTFMTREAVTARQIIYGQIRTSGPLVFIDETGTNNEYLHMVVALAGHECEEISTVYFNDEALSLDGSGNVTSPSKYVGHARVKKHLGSPTQSADSDLVAESPRWTTNHRGRSVCYVYVRLKWSAEVFPTGWPNVSALVKGKLVYDSRTATTAWSANWALCLADFMTDERLGLGTPYSTLDDTALQAAANVADEAVPINPSGTEKRYTINGQISADSAPGDVIDQMVRAGAGFCGYIGGKWVIHAGAYRTPTVALDENDLRGPIRAQTKLSRAENFNAAKGIFTSPENQWQPSDYPAVTNATYETQDDGVRIYRDFEWPFTTSNATAQRLSKIALERVRQPITVNLSCKLTAMQVQAGDNVQLTIARFGWTDKVFEVVSSKFIVDQQSSGPALGYDLILRETASGVWDWNDGEETEIDLAPNTNLPDPRTVADPTGLTLTSDATTTSIQADGTVVPRILAEWIAPADEFATSGGRIRVEYKLNAASELKWNFWAYARGDEVESYVTAVVIGESYNVRIRAENTIGGVSAWVSATISAAGDTAAPSAPTGLTATSGAGFISLDWNDNTEADLGEYGVYRHTSNVFGSATKIAEVLASRFVDASGLTTGVTYYYWITAIDRSENESSPSTSANAAPTAPINTGTPSTPSAPTFSSESTYLAGDGTVAAYIIVNTPALPSGAIANDILYRVNGSSSWIIADQQYGAGTARIDDMTPGITYQFAVRSLSNAGTPSAVSGILSRAAPNKSSGPTAPSAITMTAGNNAAYDGPPQFYGGALALCAVIKFTEPADKDISYYEWAVSTVNTDAGADAATKFVTSVPRVDFNFESRTFGSAWYLRIRSVDNTGNAGSWASFGLDIRFYIGIAAGNLSNQDANDVQVTAIETGNGASVQQVLARFPVSDVISLTGGSPTETISVSLTNRGFSTKPDVGFVECSTDPNIQASYDFDNASNSSTVAYIDLETMDGTNLPSGNQRFSIEFIEYL